jgi:hypothetical protein
MGSSTIIHSGSGVVDVAGGRGDVSVELILRGVRCTLIEPRWRKLSSQQRNLISDRGLDVKKPFVHLITRLDEDFASVEEHRALLTNASLLVGLHPYQVYYSEVHYCVCFILSITLHYYSLFPASSFFMFAFF